MKYNSDQNVICIVAGGWSVQEVDVERLPGVIMAVNDSAVHLPKFDIVVSMDRLWTENRWNFLREKAKPAYIRRQALMKIENTKWPWLEIFDCDHQSTQFSDIETRVNGTNSAMCAFNKAYQFKPKKIFLVGFDMCLGPKGQTHWYPTYPWAGRSHTVGNKLQSWAKQYDLPAKSCKKAGIEVFVVGERSLIKTFPRISPEKLYEQ